jgi:hypothetical protein
MKHHLPVSLVCGVLGAPRSTIYARRRASGQPSRPGPTSPIGATRGWCGWSGKSSGTRRLLGRATARCGPVCVASTACRSAANGCCGCFGARDCWLPNASVAGASRGRMTARSSRRRPTCGGAPTRPWPGPARRVGVGVCLRGSLHRRGLGARGRGGRPLRRPAAGLRRGDRPLGPAGRRHRPRRAAAPRPGDPSTARSTSWARWPGWASPTTPPS